MSRIYQLDVNVELKFNLAIVYNRNLLIIIKYMFQSPTVLTRDAQTVGFDRVVDHHTF